MTAHFSHRFPTLFRTNWPTGGLAESIHSIDVDLLCDEYHEWRITAPKRSAKNKRYFVGHDGRVNTRDRDNPSENHLAIALWNMDALLHPPNARQVRLLDYQVPLQASRSDAGLGKLDLFGVTREGRLVVVELKVPRKNGGRGDAPIAALMEGLRYAAVVEANHQSIAAEIRDAFSLRVRGEPPIVLILAPEEWWRGWQEMGRRTRRAAGRWEPRIVELMAKLEDRLGIAVECASLESTGLADIDLQAPVPRLRQIPRVRTVGLDEVHVQQSPADYASYEDNVSRLLWAWADQHHPSELDGGSRARRPPVLSPEHESRAVLVPPESVRARHIVSAIAKRERHRWFRSLKSSQALTQSVFGAIRAFHRLDLLQGINAECGRAAFLDDTRHATLILEHNVCDLDEPRPTSVDVFLQGPSGRVAVECKLMEKEFGRCSRPNLRPSASNYNQQHCDGNYRRQRGRNERCALTEIGIRYWQHVPRLFDWKSDVDLLPCPFNPVYQLARNALAATVTGSRLEPDAGHVLVVYDARNPEYQTGGVAQEQYESAVEACRVPGLIRRVTWQRLARSLNGVPELAYLLTGLANKYGITPE